MADGKKVRQAADMAGNVYGRITVLCRAYSKRPEDAKQTMWLCRCECGNEKIINGRSLRSGATRSCGCFNLENITTHGHGGVGPKRSKTYQSWYAMINRCNNPATPNWDRYGGRGIAVCERWRAFENFLSDMGERPVGTSLDRTDNDGNYEPGNCKWATTKAQAQNKEAVELIEIEGIEMTRHGWSICVGIGSNTIKDRRKRGWSWYDAVFTKPGQSPSPN